MNLQEPAQNLGPNKDLAPSGEAPEKQIELSEEELGKVAGAGPGSPVKGIDVGLVKKPSPGTNRFG